jgi:hypothetical protein
MKKLDNFRVGRKMWNYYKKLFPKKTHLLLTAFPKSGSTYLRTLISNLDKMGYVTLVTGHDRREQELAVERLIFLHRKNYVAQHHTRYSLITEMLMQDFNIKPIVLVRNIFDVVESLHDHFHKEGLPLPMAYLPDDFLTWDRDFSRNFITQMIIPWYFNFYVSWFHYDKKLLLTYENLTKNTDDVLKKIVQFSGIKTSHHEIENSILKATKQSTRKNIGKSGRGENLSEEIKEKIQNMTKFYPTVDFSPIGL